LGGKTHWGLGKGSIKTRHESEDNERRKKQLKEARVCSVHRLSLKNGRANTSKTTPSAEKLAISMLLCNVAETRQQSAARSSSERRSEDKKKGRPGEALVSQK